MDTPRGTRDFLPADMEHRRGLEIKLRTVAEAHGFGEVSTPTFEEKELFVMRSGEAILEELYAFKDKGGRDIALRPEITAPVMRLYVNKLQFEPKPLKVYYMSNAFRYERPQSGRYREFWQFGAETIGAEGELAAAESIAMAYNMVKESGVTDIILRVGHIGMLKSLLEDAGIPLEEQYPFLHMADKGELDELKVALANRVDHNFADTIASLVENPQDLDGATSIVIGSEKAKESLESLKTTIKQLNWYGIENVQPDLAVVRGLDYYSGVVFEIDAPRLGAEKQVCGGGEYRLAHIFGGKDVATVGYAIGFDRLLLAAEQEGVKAQSQTIDYYIIPVSPEVAETCVDIAQKLRAKGNTVDMDLVGRNVKKNMKYASSRNAKNVIIIGPRDLEQGACTIRNMADGKEQQVKLSEF